MRLVEVFGVAPKRISEPFLAYVLMRMHMLSVHYLCAIITCTLYILYVVCTYVHTVY